MLRVPRELRAARVGEDQVRALFDRVLDPRRGDRVIDHRIGADQQHDLGLRHVHHRVRHRAGADALEQRRDARRVAEPSAVIDVVGSEPGAHELLEEIRLLVRALRRAEARERARAVRVADSRERAAGEIERLVPGRLAEHGEGIRRVDDKFAGFRKAGLPDERLRQALRVRDVIEAEASLHAQPVVIGGPVAPGDADDRVVLHVIGELAADAAVRAHRVHGAIGGDNVCVVRRRERAGRAGLHAFAAGDAGRRAHRIVEVEHDLRPGTAKGVADHVVDLHLAARAHAARALDAGIEVDCHRRMRDVGGWLRACREARLADAERPPPVFELGIGLVDAFRHVRDEHLDDDFLRETRARAPALHFHAGRRRATARRRQHALALDLDDAGAAVAVRAHPGLVAKARNLDAVPRRGLDDRLARCRRNLAAVQRKADRADVVRGFQGDAHGLTSM